MGGAKKKGLAQMEKAQSAQEKPTSPKKKEKPAAAEKRLKGIDAPNVDEQRIASEIRKMGALTPFTVASQFNLRLGAAKDFLEELARKKVIEPVGGNSRVRIYRAVAA